MAKINFKNLVPIKNILGEEIQIGNELVTVEKYLPLAKKAELIEWVIKNSIDDTGFASPIRTEVFLKLAIVRYYTNISITEKMLETPDKVFDSLMINNVFDIVLAAIPEEELDRIESGALESVKAVQDYMSSFLGVLKNVSQDYDSTKMNVDELMKSLDQPEKVGLVKDILEKIG